MYFIRLTDINGNPITVNADRIEVITGDSSGTTIWFGADVRNIVREKPERIMQMLQWDNRHPKTLGPYETCPQCKERIYLELQPDACSHCDWQRQGGTAGAA